MSAGSGTSCPLTQATYARALSLSREGMSQTGIRTAAHQRLDAMLATVADGDAALVVGGDLTVLVAEVRCLGQGLRPSVRACGHFMAGAVLHTVGAILPAGHPASQPKQKTWCIGTVIGKALFKCRSCLIRPAVDVMCGTVSCGLLLGQWL